MTAVSNLLETAVGYRLWQAPFADRKLAPLLSTNDLGVVRRVLDVGCGPGTNTKYFGHAEYIGVDLNERYIANARRRHGRTFITADVREFRIAGRDRFDFILVNSLLHHLDTSSAGIVLTHLRELLSEEGCIHVLDLVLPPERSIARALAKLDRGDYPRPLEEWREMLTDLFEPVIFQPYTLGLGRLALWNMLYFKGRRREK